MTAPHKFEQLGSRLIRAIDLDPRLLHRLPDTVAEKAAEIIAERSRDWAPEDLDPLDRAARAIVDQAVA